REQLRLLVQWLREPGRPMPKEDLLGWIKERMPKPVVKAKEPEKRVYSDEETIEFLESLERGAAMPGWKEQILADWAAARIPKMGDSSKVSRVVTAPAVPATRDPPAAP